MVTRDNRDMQFKSDRSDCEDKPPLKDCTNKEVAYPVEGEVFVIRHTIQVQVKEDDID